MDSTRKKLFEVIDFYKVDSLLDDDDEFSGENDDFMGDSGENDDFPDDFPTEDEFPDDFPIEDEFSDDEFSDDEFSDDEFSDDEFSDEEETDAPKGMIRIVRGAYMVYKKPTPSNNFEELWIYNIRDVKNQTKLRNAILAGTDIDPVKLHSPDGEQRASIDTIGNVQFLHIDGVPN